MNLMKLLLLSLVLLLGGCGEQRSLKLPEVPVSVFEIRDIQRDIKAIKNELMGFDTGCRLEKVIYELGEYRDSDKRAGETYVKTICKGDTREVDSSQPQE